MHSSFVYKNKIIIQIKPLGIAQQVVKAGTRLPVHVGHVLHVIPDSLPLLTCVLHCTVT